jgi:predicted TIM-barrel fold metal-dependent hydrolase
MLIDALAIVGPNLFVASPSLPELVAASSAQGIHGLVVAPGRPFDYALPPANERLAQVAGAQPDIARLGRVDPLQGRDAVVEARRCLRDLSCSGLFLHPGEESFQVRAAVDVLKEAANFGAPVVVAAGLYGLSEPLQVLRLTAAVPDATVIMTSAGQINISGLSMVDAWAALERHPNLHVMVNGEYRQDFIERVVRDLDPRRVLFASFSPYYDQGFEVARIRNATMDRDARRLVEGENAARLFGLTPRTGPELD